MPEKIINKEDMEFLDSIGLREIDEIAIINRT